MNNHDFSKALISRYQCQNLMFSVSFSSGLSGLGIRKDFAK